MSLLSIGLLGALVASGRESTSDTCLALEGTPRTSKKAVRAALDWLQRHQHPDGYWSSKDFTKRCASESAPCTHKEKEHTYTDGRGWEGFDIGVTALALNAFVGNGYTHQRGERPEHREAVNRAFRWLIAQQVESDKSTENGRFGATAGEQWIYSHAIATMALAELLRASADKGSLRKSVEAATEWCLLARNEGYAWKYGFRAGKNDTSVTGWMVSALNSSQACREKGLIQTKKSDIDAGLKGAAAWVARVTAPDTGITGYEGPGDAGSVLLRVYPDPYPFSKYLSPMTAVGISCRIFAGEARESVPIQRGVDVLMKELPEWRPADGKTGLSKINLYYWYYATAALDEYGGQSAKTWMSVMSPVLRDHQRVGGCEDGSWDPIDEWGAAGGRVYSTALGAMTLKLSSK